MWNTWEGSIKGSYFSFFYRNLKGQKRISLLWRKVTSEICTLVTFVTFRPFLVCVLNNEWAFHSWAAYTIYWLLCTEAYRLWTDFHNLLAYSQLHQPREKGISQKVKLIRNILFMMYFPAELKRDQRKK